MKPQETAIAPPEEIIDSRRIYVGYIVRLSEWVQIEQQTEKIKVSNPQHIIVAPQQARADSVCNNEQCEEGDRGYLYARSDIQTLWSAISDDNELLGMHAHTHTHKTCEMMRSNAAHKRN